jgi:hypothetical protein
MIPLTVLLLAFSAFRLAGLIIPYFVDWQISLRAALGVMFFLTATAHWAKAASRQHASP